MNHGGVELDWRLDPTDALRCWRADERVAMLHSGRFHPQWSRWSVLAQPVATYRFLTDGREGRSEWRSPYAAQGSPELSHKPFHDLRAAIDSRDGGIWIGCVSYDIARWIERIGDVADADRDWPVIEFGYCPGYLVFDGLKKRWFACGTWRNGGYPDLGAQTAKHAPFRATAVNSVFTRAEYEASVKRVIEYIHAGDAFQVNLAQRFTAELAGSYPIAHRDLFANLASVSPAWYGAYIELAADERTGINRVLASTSPELFLQVDAQGNVITRPIKGTRPAKVDPAELEHSEKDQAELHMIVDLMRNDLGRVCSYGSIKVTRARAIETHPTVHHGVATIEGRLHESKDTIDLLRATLPGGSITGAPKIRAMQIIDELERVRRGPYCGCVGYLSRDAGSCLNIAIRTLLIETPAHNDLGRVDFSVGGGIVADSNPAGEYAETIDKAKAMCDALGLKLDA